MQPGTFRHVTSLEINYDALLNLKIDMPALVEFTIRRPVWLYQRASDLEDNLMSQYFTASNFKGLKTIRLEINSDEACAPALA